MDGWTDVRKFFYLLYLKAHVTSCTLKSEEISCALSEKYPEDPFSCDKLACSRGKIMQNVYIE